MTNKGGRGKKALYKTTHSRIPENLKIVVDSISDLYKQYVRESGCLDFDHKSLLPSVSAIYIVFNESEILYVGQTKNLTSRWKSHHLLKSIREINEEQSVSIAWINYEQKNLLTSLEKLLIEGLQPRFNSSQENHLLGSSWNLGKTETIRIPIALKDRLMEIARHLDRGGTVVLNSQEPKKPSHSHSKTVLSQDDLNEVISTLQLGITSKKQGGLYDSSNASTLKKEVLKALEILRKKKNV